jgi:hypothetical protein
MNNGPSPLKCPRCDTELHYGGAKAFHEGTRIGFPGELSELLGKSVKFDVYVCTRCGRVELFVDSIGQQLRPK